MGRRRREQSFNPREASNPSEPTRRALVSQLDARLSYEAGSSESSPAKAIFFEIRRVNSLRPFVPHKYSARCQSSSYRPGKCRFSRLTNSVRMARKRQWSDIAEPTGNGTCPSSYFQESGVRLRADSVPQVTVTSARDRLQGVLKEKQSRLVKLMELERKLFFREFAYISGGMWGNVHEGALQRSKTNGPRDFLVPHPQGFRGKTELSEPQLCFGRFTSSGNSINCSSTLTIHCGRSFR
jgi:hypothetical protein